jgi:hypothetical protein
MFLDIVKKEVKDFITDMIVFCNDRGIDPTLSNFLSVRKAGAQMPECIYFLMGKKFSKYYLFNSKKFNSFFQTLPTDFKKDIASQNDLQKIKLLTLADSEVSQYLKRILKEDYIW